MIWRVEIRTMKRRSIEQWLLIAPCPALFSWLFVDQHILLPLARLLVGAVDAPHPATRSLLSFKQFFDGTTDTLDPRFLLLGIFHPADEFVAADGRQTLPQRQHFFIDTQRMRQIIGHFMDQTTCNFRHRFSIPILQPHPLANASI